MRKRWGWILGYGDGAFVAVSSDDETCQKDCKRGGNTNQHNAGFFHNAIPPGLTRREKADIIIACIIHEILLPDKSGVGY